MLSRIVESIVAFLDWCWPFPLGAFAVALAFSVSSVIWLVFGQAGSPLRPSPRIYTHSAASSPALQEELTTPSPSVAPGLPDPSVAKAHHPSGSVLGDTSRAGAFFRPDSANRIPVPEPRTHGAEISTAREVAASTRTAAAHPQVQRQILKTETKAASPVSLLSPAQESELRDKLTLGRFFVDRKDYRAAVAEFQAALAIDPSNREAQAAIQQARDAGKGPESSPQP